MSFAGEMGIIGTILVFSDECGNYLSNRSMRFKQRHPFYVRSTVMMDVSEYREFEKDIIKLKERLGFPPNCEIKWSHMGDIRHGHPPEGLEGHSVESVKNYIKRFLNRAAMATSLRYIFTVTDNNSPMHISYENIITWHIQNALQRVQRDLQRHDNYGVVIIDDLNDQNKTINRRCYQAMCDGDFVTYDNLKKSILIDYSHQCLGLQLADIAAGVFTGAMIRESTGTQGYPFAAELYADILTQNIRCAATAGAHSYSPYATSGYGMISIPSANCGDILSKMEKILEAKELNRLFGE